MKMNGKKIYTRAQGRAVQTPPAALSSTLTFPETTSLTTDRISEKLLKVV